ncbi:hypothetical protein [Brumimicrobium aurantiacum]|uniref:Uncharacterized protein n=1 Tax=Brumimicrobium aurantiacum TaxID=1737063 RepID=A0A3E1F1N0_9FLAO|nr:hypothetical protein [Brumimicrobium aurantiacum]RFC55649.1 hypothetical protein DXU93_01575 [Brumimicrobium aurantiacum]
MKKNLFLLIILMSSTNMFSQIDYKKVSEEFTISCGTESADDLSRSKKFLDSLSQFKINNGEEEYLYDVGMTNYKAYLKWKDKSALIISTEANQKCWDKYQNYNALWNLGMNYGLLDNCDKKLELTELYIKHLSENDLVEFIDYQQVYYRYKFCRNK